MANFEAFCHGKNFPQKKMTEERRRRRRRKKKEECSVIKSPSLRLRRLEKC